MSAQQLGMFPAEAAPYMLTVRQPWAWAIIHAGKDVENRSRAIRYRGMLLIHAGKSWSAEGEAWLRAMGIEPPADLPSGAIIGSVEVMGSVQHSVSPWAMPEHHHWLLTDPHAAVEPMQCRGVLGLVRAPEGWGHAFTAQGAGTQTIW